MTWDSKYWDTLDQLYWSPGYLGLSSIPKKQLSENEEFILVPHDQVKKGGTIYTREGNAKSNSVRMKGLEETLNHIFDITFAIAPDEVVQELFHKQAGIADQGPFESIGREIRTRYEWGNANVTQQDGLLVSSNSVLGVELKLGSKTWCEQVLKYLMIMVQEEKLGGERPDIGLLYITPNSFDEVMQHAGAEKTGGLPESFLGDFDPAKMNATMRKILEADREALESAASRVSLSHMSWAELAAKCEALIEDLEGKSAGNQTLERLLLGFVSAVKEHSGVGI